MSDKKEEVKEDEDQEDDKKNIFINYLIRYQIKNGTWLARLFIYTNPSHRAIVQLPQ